ncbi:hypothetical protein [Virgibacillus pantothenticus]|nr:hypothetical protein [Virgibacillus pantothenticus]
MDTVPLGCEIHTTAVQPVGTGFIRRTTDPMDIPGRTNGRA